MVSSSKKKRTFRSQAQWQSLIDKHAVSGQTVEQFCKEESLSVSAFYRQRQQLISCAKAKGTSPLTAKQGPQSFFELTMPVSNDSPKQVSPSDEPDWCVELQIGEHIVLKVRP